jgi:crotonobetainyl-CoA:carnitine CoA-transferase CaiB-like acyl-CoA transferase
MYGGLRVLDLAGERGMLCGRILAELGADVIAVEPPGGSPVRRLAPFYKDEPGAERSLWWWAYARGKRSIALDPEAARDRETLLALADGADVWIESEPPGRLASLGLGYDALAARNPALVAVSITPFGQNGPKAAWADCELVGWASAGVHWLSGDPDRAPLRISAPQAYLHAGAEAAVAALVALHERRRSGLGQHVDVSVQQAVTMCTLGAILQPALRAQPFGRAAGVAKLGDAEVRSLLRTRDGYALHLAGILPSVAGFMRRMVDWLIEDGRLEPRYAQEDWASFGMRLLFGQLHQADWEPVQRALDAHFAARTKRELLDAAVERKLLVAPLLDLRELAESPQLAAREWVSEVAHPEHEASLRYPGPFARFSRTPLQLGRRAPLFDEHRAEILAEPTRRPPQPTARAAPASRPLEGVKVVDLFWVLAGPGATRVLADYGATVVHVESTLRVDTLRTIGPWHDHQPHPDTTGAFQDTNAGKLGLTLDLTRPEGREVLWDLVRWADVLTESFSPGAIASLGFDYASVRAANPGIVMISSCLMGQTGPHAGLSGFGQLAASLTGFAKLCGWPDRAPAGPWGAYTDYVGVRYNAIAILAALEHRARTGEGQYIDMAQAEAALQFLAPAFLDYTANGRVAEPCGNADPLCAPHGVYPCAGEDRWIALAARDDGEWRALGEALGAAELAADARFATPAARLAAREALDLELAARTRARDALELERALQARRVPAHVVAAMDDLWNDPQLHAREHFLSIPHPTQGTTVVESSRFRLSRTPAAPPAKALTYGCDNAHVLGSILGYSAERIAALEAAGALR